MMLSDDLFVEMTTAVRAAVAAAAPAVDVVEGDFNASHEAPAVHTVPGDFSFRVADEFSNLSVEKLSLRTPFGSLSGSFGVVVGAPTFSELATLTEAARVGVVNFAESLASQGPPIRAYAEISFIGRHESDFTANAPFVREIRVAVQARATKFWRQQQ